VGWFKQKKEPCTHDWEYVPGKSCTDYDIIKSLQKCIPIVVNRKSRDLRVNGDPIWDEERILVEYPGMVLDQDNWRMYGVKVCLKCRTMVDEVSDRMEEWTTIVCEAEEKERNRMLRHNDRQRLAKEIYDAISKT
jgi:hypothetical protein